MGREPAGAGLTLVTGQKVLDEGGDNLMLETIEIGVFKEGNVARATDAFYVA